MTANVGVIIGPMLGGLTSDPVAAYPELFGRVQWLERFPYSPPNIIGAMILGAASLSVWLGMEEVTWQIFIKGIIILTTIDSCKLYSPGRLWYQVESQSHIPVEVVARQEKRRRTCLYGY
jgi:hypothetical protein